MLRSDLSWLLRCGRAGPNLTLPLGARAGAAQVRPRLVPNLTLPLGARAGAAQRPVLAAQVRPRLAPNLTLPLGTRAGAAQRPVLAAQVRPRRAPNLTLPLGARAGAAQVPLRLVRCNRGHLLRPRVCRPADASACTGQFVCWHQRCYVLSFMSNATVLALFTSSSCAHVVGAPGWSGARRRWARCPRTSATEHGFLFVGRFCL